MMTMMMMMMTTNQPKLKKQGCFAEKLCDAEVGTCGDDDGNDVDDCWWW